MSDKIIIVTFGDSITEAAAGLSLDQRWPVLLEKKLNNSERAEYCVINSGVGGNTSREGLARIDRDVISHKPDIVLVEFGGNDIVADEKREVSLEEYRSNLKAIHEKLADIDAEMILLTFTPVINNWCSDGKHEKYAHSGGLDEFIELYRDATREFVKEQGLKLIDVDLALRKACDKLSQEEIILKDGCHLTAKANEIIAETVYDYLKGYSCKCMDYVHLLG